MELIRLRFLIRFLIRLPGASSRVFEWGTNRRQAANLPPKYSKNRKSNGFGPFILESGGGRPLLNLSLGDTSPPSPSPPSTPMSVTILDSVLDLVAILGSVLWFLIWLPLHREGVTE